MGLLGCMLRCAVRWILIVTILLTVVLVIPNLPPYCNFTAISFPPTKPWEGALAKNNVLDGVKRLYDNKLSGPEALQLFNGELYTSLLTGEVVKLSPGGHITFVTKIGQPCEGTWQPSKCGRPLGFAIEETGKYLYVSDAYYGIWKVDLKTDKKQLLVSPRVEIEGRKPMIFNSIALAKNGDFYWTDSSSDFTLGDGSYTSMVDPSGRLLYYSAATNTSKVLLDNIWFSNGVAISPDNQFVIVVETFGYGILKHYVNGPKKGQTEPFVEGLPGAPDNIQTLPDGSGVLVSLFLTFDEDEPLLLRSTGPLPVVRKLIARLLRLVEIPFEFLNQQVPHHLFEKVLHTIGSFESVAVLSPKGAGLIQLDWNGNIVASWFSTGAAGPVSDAVVYQDNLYLGSPHNSFVGVVPAPEGLKKAFSKAKQTPPPKTAQTVTEKIPEVKQEKVKPVETKPATPTKPVEQQKPTPKPVEQPKPTQKPVEQPKPTPKPVEQPKPTPKPVEQPKPAQKPVTKPVEQPKPTAKPVEQPKPVEQTKTTTPKPTAKPTEQAKQTKPAEQKPSTQQTKPKAEKPKPPKPVDQAKLQKQKPVETEQKKPEKIPIVEEIPSDTAKPVKEKLQVISKEGPATIPNPEL